MWRRIISKFGNDSIHEAPQERRTMWLGANVVTTILTGMLLVPDLPYLQAMVIVLFGPLLGAVWLALVGVMGTRTGLPTMV